MRKKKNRLQQLKQYNSTKLKDHYEFVKQQRNWFSLRTRLTLLVTAELLVSVTLAVGAATLLNRLFPNLQLPLLVELLAIALLIGGAVTAFLSKFFFDPIKRLREAMAQVAEGEFSVRLDPSSSFQEIREVYTGFNLMTHELSATEVLQTDFVSNVSHEFKTPISAIEGYATLLQGTENLDEDQQNYIDKILHNTRRLSNLTGNILLLSKIENQNIETHQTRYRLDEQIRQCIVDLEPAWSLKDTEFDVDLEGVEYLGNESLLRHVWENLIGNAVKFGPEGGLVTIGMKTEEEKIRITVEDEGTGFSEETQRHLFDKFYQGDSSHKQEGNGLGLALVSRILHLTGGTIAAENRPEGGAKFTVTLLK
ncbi:MAG: HAMP domain-containing histidine kinase [Clostridiales bacterium]|nr:HAMP domain-containing histidine kinase [Clostridiales bacterium]